MVKRKDFFDTSEGYDEDRKSKIMDSRLNMSENAPAKKNNKAQRYLFAI